MPRNNIEKRNRSSSILSPTTDDKQYKWFTTPNKYVALSKDTSSLPEVFSCPSFLEPSSALKENPNETSVQTFNNTSSNRIPTIYVRNIKNFTKVLSSLLRLESVTFKSSKEFLIMVNHDHWSKMVEILANSKMQFHSHLPQIT